MTVGQSRIPPLRLIPPGAAHLAGDPDAPWTLVLPADPDAIDVLARTGTEPRMDGLSITARLPRALLPGLADAFAARSVPAGRILRRALWPVINWQLRTTELPMDRPHIMGIVNLTDDSFSGDGVGQDVASALRLADELRSAGASLIDVGAESARADRPVLEEMAEARLVAAAVGALAREGHAVSVDSYKPAVVRAALDAGAEVVNDISGLTLGTGAVEAAFEAGAAYVLNYSYSVPKRRPESAPVYDDVVAETLAWMFERIETLRGLGLGDQQVAIDPGIAFGKSHDEDIQVLRRLEELTTPGLPLLLAHSRKNFIGSVTGRPPTERDLESHVAAALAYAQGARIFRVHDVEGAKRALEMAAAIVSARPGAFAPDADSWPWRSGASATHMTRGGATAAAPPGQRW